MSSPLALALQEKRTGPTTVTDPITTNTATATALCPPRQAGLRDRGRGRQREGEILRIHARKKDAHPGHAPVRTSSRAAIHLGIVRLLPGSVAPAIGRPPWRQEHPRTTSGHADPGGARLVGIVAPPATSTTTTLTTTRPAPTRWRSRHRLTWRARCPEHEDDRDDGHRTEGDTDSRRQKGRRWPGSA